MDYLTKPTSRWKLRRLAPVFRQLFDVDEDSKFPVLDALERVRDVFRGCWYEIVNDSDLPADTPAQCKLIEDESFIIQIKQSVYDGAYLYDIGAFRGHILHEIVHVFLYKIGFTPVYTRSFENEEIPAYRSVEWQTKALTGEIMMPYHATRGMCRSDIMQRYGVSKGFALYRQTY